MAMRFTATTATVRDDPELNCRTVGVSERADESGFGLIFQSNLEMPDAQDIALGMDTYCLITTEQGAAYGCVAEAVLSGYTLRIVVTPESMDLLELSENEIIVQLDLDDEVITHVAAGLRKTLGYGRVDALPQVMRV